MKGIKNVNDGKKSLDGIRRNGKTPNWDQATGLGQSCLFPSML